MRRKWEYSDFKMKLNRVRHETYKDKFLNACRCGIVDKLYEYICCLSYHTRQVINQGLVIACENNKIQVVKKLLLCKNISLNCGSGLIAADQKGHVNIVELLIETNKSNLNNALEIACQDESKIKELKLHDPIITIDRLLNYGADINKGLISACSCNNMMVIQLLLQRGAKLTDRTWGIAQQNGHIPLVQIHIDSGFDIPYIFIGYALTEQHIKLSILLLNCKYQKTKQPHNLHRTITNINITKRHNPVLASLNERFICELLDANCQIIHPNIKRIKRWRSHRNRRILAAVDNVMLSLKLNFDVYNLKIIESYLSHEPKHY